MSRCLCNKKCTYVCKVCTKGPFALWPCHPPTTNWHGRITHHDCLDYHQAHPGEIPRGRQRRQRQGKRARREKSPERDGSDESDAEENGSADGCSMCSDNE
jgi:hypothetical protein